MRLTLTMLAAVTGLAACETVEPETLEQSSMRLERACPSLIERSAQTGDVDFNIDDCRCVAKRIVTPMYNSASMRNDGPPIPRKDGVTIADTLQRAATFAQGLEDLDDRLSSATLTHVNFCFTK